MVGVMMMRRARRRREGNGGGGGGDDGGAAPAGWYAAAMAAGGVVPATATPSVPVVVPYNLVPGTRGMNTPSVGRGADAAAAMMMYPPPPMMPAGDAAYAQMMACWRVLRDGDV